jgi:predicted aldo/keto reductase-like oxidoreductase
MNFRAMFEPYTLADEKLLVRLNEQIRPDYCGMCYECKDGFPKGLLVEMLRFLSHQDYYDDYHRAVVSFRDLAEEVCDVRCNDCDTCAVQCPNGVHVQDHLICAQHLLS